MKVGKIAFQGNNSLNDRTLRGAMKNLKPIGVPHSIILENLFARTFDASKLDEDTERVRQAYRDRGYFKAQTSDADDPCSRRGGLNPFTLRPSKGKRIDILMPVEEGERYRLAGITFTGTSACAECERRCERSLLRRTASGSTRPCSARGWTNCAKQYGALGYINMAGTPSPKVDEVKKTIYAEYRHRRRQAVLCFADRVYGQHDYSRQGDSARAAAGRRADLQQPVVGAVDSAVEPAELLRDAEGGPGLGEPPECGRVRRSICC